ncbi:MAG TPA: flavin reductase family protein [Terriglobia bacterium]|nr:flavin reductase family protein [Terriglobia bacterium]
MAFDQRDFRTALGQFATGITVVTARSADGELLGVTVNSFNSVSLEPPLILFSLERRAFSLPAFETAGAFAVNILSDEQTALSQNFARTQGDKWAGIAYEHWVTGSPILRGCLAAFDCRTHAVHDGGDHRIFLGEVLRFEALSEGEPLIYFRGSYTGLK